MERRPVTAEVESSSLFRVAAVFTANLIFFLLWDLSSAGRASALQAEGHRFEPYRSHMDGFPSGQRGQTVNLLAMPSKVRILLHPLYSKLPGIFTWEFCCHTPKRFESFSIHYYSRAYSLWSFSVIHQSDSNPSPSTISPERICSGVFYPSSLYQQRSALIPNFLFPP